MKGDAAPAHARRVALDAVAPLPHVLVACSRAPAPPPACRDVQQQLVDREREAEILEAEVAELTRFLDSLVSGPASSDKVAEMLDRELKAARKRVNKLSRDCQVLQDMLYAKSMEMARWAVAQGHVRHHTWQLLV
jgi:hypothetical protein